jgi:Mrp family chromosome partitioning ATPase
VTDILSHDATVVAGIAALGMAALGGQSVCYVSCQDAPWLLDRLKHESTPGWTDVIRETIGLDEALQEVPDVPNLKILPMGQIDGVAHPLTEGGFEALLRALADRFRYVVIDAPSFAERPESRVLLQFVDAGLVVLRSGRSTIIGAGEMVHAVRDAGANASGIVLLRASATY